MRAWLTSLVVVAACSSREAPSPSYRDGIIEVVLTTGAAEVELDDVERALGRDARVSAIAWEGARAMLVRAPLRPADAAAREAAIAAIRARAGDAIARAAWGGDRLRVNATREVPEALYREALATAGLEVTKLTATPVPELGEVSVVIQVAGQDLAIERAIERALGIEATVVRVEMVGPQSLARPMQRRVASTRPRAAGESVRSLRAVIAARFRPPGRVRPVARRSR